MLQPIGLDDNHQAFYEMFDAWKADIIDQHPEADEVAWHAFRSNMYDGDFLFNTSRGISACGWLPWITSIIPAAVRGKYLTRESAVANLASLLAFLLAAVVLGSDPGGARFAALFAFSA